MSCVISGPPDSYGRHLLKFVRCALCLMENGSVGLHMCAVACRQVCVCMGGMGRGKCIAHNKMNVVLVRKLSSGLYGHCRLAAMNL